MTFFFDNKLKSEHSCAAKSLTRTNPNPIHTQKYYVCISSHNTLKIVNNLLYQNIVLKSFFTVWKKNSQQFCYVWMQRRQIGFLFWATSKWYTIILCQHFCYCFEAIFYFILFFFSWIICIEGIVFCFINLQSLLSFWKSLYQESVWHVASGWCNGLIRVILSCSAIASIYEFTNVIQMIVSTKRSIVFKISTEYTQ